MKIDWLYLRKGWKSCTKSQEALEQASIVAGEIEDARKNVIKADGAWEMIVKAKSLSVGRGKKVQTFIPDEGSKGEILKVCLGRTGNLRAPTARSGKQLYVGFNEEMYKELTA